MVTAPIEAEKRASAGFLVQSELSETIEVTSSPSPIQLPRSVQQDQFQANPAIDKSAHSIASSRRESRERKSAFLPSHQRQGHGWMHCAYKNNNQGSPESCTSSRSSFKNGLTGTGG